MYEMLHRAFLQATVVLSRVWCLLESPFGCATGVPSWVRLWCGLKSNTGYVGSESTWPGLGYWLMSDILTDFGLPMCNYRAIHFLWLHILGFGVH